MLSVLVCSLTGCAASYLVSDEPADDPVEDAIEELGVKIPGCETGGYANKTLTLTVDVDPLVLSAAAGKITANGFVCKGTVGTVPNSKLTVNDVEKVVIYGSAADNKVVIDFLPGLFSTKLMGVNGGFLVNFKDNSASSPGTGAGNDSLMLRGRASNDIYKFGKVASSADVYIECNGDKVADIAVKPATAVGASLTLAASLGAGSDTLNASPTTTDFDKFSALTGLVIGRMALGITAYGGAGDDRFIGGAGNDVFFGGDGVDNFKADGASDGADVYSGDNGLDTVDYSSRTGNMNIDLGPLSPALEGSVDMATPALYGSSGTLNGTTLGIAVDNKRVEATFTAPASAGAVLSAINTAANLALGSGSQVYATLKGKNRLVITNPLGTPTSPIQLQGALALALSAGNAADSILGLVPTAATASPISGIVDLTGLTYGGSGSLTGKRLVLIVNGVYVAVTFSNEANVAAMLDAINDAVDAAVGTIGGTYATQDGSHHIVLSASTVAVVDGAAAKSLTSAHTALGLTPGDPVASIVDADDGLIDADPNTPGDQPEADDVRYSTEVILSGSGDDVLWGNELKNTIKGGVGNDHISGGSNRSCGTSDGDILVGDAGDDTFWSPMINCRQGLTGAAGNNTVNFSGRTPNLVLKNDGSANDGETNELANVGADILTMIGGFGADQITGGTGNDTIVGGPGADTLVGGAGTGDTVDYSASPADVNVSMCFASTISSCPAADDGMTGEMDQVYQFEHLIGSAFGDQLSAATAPANISVIIEGRDLGDTITGGAGIDSLYGENGNDHVYGGSGDDTLEGGAGDDALDGGLGGDQCNGDSSDTTPKVECELGS